MNQYTTRERQAADLIVFEAIAHAKTYSGPVTDDTLAAAIGIVLTAFELLTPGITPEQRRELFLREDKE